MIALFITCTSPLYSQLGPIHPPLDEKSPEVLKVSPSSLPSNWWEQIIQHQTDRKQILESFVSELRHYPSGMDEITKQKANVLIQSIEANAEAYLSATEQGHDGPQHQIMSFQKSYSLNEFIDLAESRQSLRSRIETTSINLDQLETSINQSNGELDRDWIEYSSAKPNAPERYLLGLEIIADQLKLAIKLENKRLLKSKLESFEKEQDHLNQELEHARNHLDLGRFDPNAWEIELQQSLQQQEIAQTNVAVAYANMNPAFPDTPIGQSKRALQNIQLNFLAVQEETAAASVLIEKMKKAFTLLKSDPDSISKIKTTDQVRKWEKSLDLLEMKVKGHHNLLKEEQENLRLVYLQDENPTPNDQKQFELLFRERLNDIQELYIALHELENQITIAQFLLQEYEHLISSRGNILTIGLLSLWTFTIRFWETISHWLFTPLFKFGGVPVTFFSILELVLIICAALLLSAFIRSGLKSLAKRRMIFEESAFYTLGRLIHYSILLCGVIIALVVVGFDFTTLALIAGALSVGIGFGLQSIVKDFINGLSILFSQNIRVGDIIEIKNQFIGKVKAINVLNTVVYHFDGLDMIVPNSEIIGSIVNNWTLSDPYRRLHVPFSIDYDIKKEIVVEAVLEAASKVPYTVKDHFSIPNPEVCIASFGDSGINMELLVWINQRVNYPTAPLYAYFWALDTAFKQRGIHMPYPQSDVHLDPLRMEGWTVKKKDE